MKDTNEVLMKDQFKIVLQAFELPYCINCWQGWQGFEKKNEKEKAFFSVALAKKNTPNEVMYHD